MSVPHLPGQVAKPLGFLDSDFCKEVKPGGSQWLFLLTVKVWVLSEDNKAQILGPANGKEEERGGKSGEHFLRGRERESEREMFSRQREAEVRGPEFPEHHRPHLYQAGIFTHTGGMWGEPLYWLRLSFLQVPRKSEVEARSKLDSWKRLARNVPCTLRLQTKVQIGYTHVSTCTGTGWVESLQIMKRCSLLEWGRGMRLGHTVLSYFF